MDSTKDNSSSKIRYREMAERIDFNQLLGRDASNLDPIDIIDSIKSTRICVTGAGGSIGSELVTQVASMGGVLLLIDINENSLSRIEIELRTNFPDVEITAVVADIKDEREINELLSTFQPDILFHAAAHKHVNLMERSPWQALKNNVGGTYTLAKIADTIEIKNFVFVSTDKAVNPTSVMGASKRLAESVILNINKKSKTKFDIVRFGNVLGSSGSVALIFKKQIAEGGPLTLTDPGMERFFMSIPEAASLILRAILIGEGGSIFILDMGNPILIKDLAESMIQQSGLTPNIDIEISIIGKRQGEKLSEELHTKSETLENTSYKKIHRITPNESDIPSLSSIDKILLEVEPYGIESTKSLIHAILPSYDPSSI